MTNFLELSDIGLEELQLWVKSTSSLILNQFFVIYGHKIWKRMNGKLMAIIDIL